MKTFIIALCASTGLASAAFAQQAANNSQTNNSNTLDEVVVTATRQVDTVNKVSLSIAAVTQKTLDQQGIKVAEDLTRTIPGLSLTTQSTGLATFAVRGIVSDVGASTTGTYLDDVSLTKRNNTGNGQNRGSAAPPLFDLDRVEVLKGPQGTLYGGSSEGGTIRYITAAPSLTTRTGKLQGEVSKVDMGDQGYTFGGAIGGPLVEGKLAFRLSGMMRAIPGWVDYTSPYTGLVIQPDANTEWDQSYQGKLLWAFSPRGSVTLSYFHDQVKLQGGPSTTTDVPSGIVFTTPAQCNSVIRTVPINNPATGQPQGYVPTVIPCPANAVPNQIVNNIFERPSFSYGPYNTVGKDTYLADNSQFVRPAQTFLNVASLTVDYDFGPVVFKSISAWVEDKTQGSNAGGEEPRSQQTTINGVNGIGKGILGFPLWGEDPTYQTTSFSKNKHSGIQQEFRLTSPAGQRPLSWVAGLYYSEQITKPKMIFWGNLDRNIGQLWGISANQRYGVPNPCEGQMCLATQDAVMKDTDLAAYGEANYWLFDRVKLTAGVRVSRVGFKYSQIAYGQYTARLPPAENPLSLTKGDITETPVSPKAGIEYDFTPNDLIYFTAAKGFRPGGVNPQLSQTQCAAGFVALAITANDIPPAYTSDSVWNYEFGGKFRLLGGKMQFNAAVFRVDWSNVQATVSVPGCGQSFVMNGAQAVSQGADLQFQYRVIDPLTLSIAAGYDDAYYVNQIAGPKPGVPGVRPSFNAGDRLAVPPWQVSASANYTFDFWGHSSYIRGDYQWQSAYTNGPSFGTAAYNPFTRFVPARDNLSLRAGMAFSTFDVNIFANNPLNSREKIGNAGNGRTACAATANASCNIYGQFNPFVQQTYERPREIGVQANLRF